MLRSTRGHIVSELCAALALFFVAALTLATCIGTAGAKPSKADIDDKCENRADVTYSPSCCLTTDAKGDCVRWGYKDCSAVMCAGRYTNVKCGICKPN